MSDYDIRPLNNAGGREEGAYVNPDGQAFFDPGTCRFMEGFSKKQEEVLKSGMERSLPVNVIAYPCITAERMECLISFMENIGGKYTLTDIYKCGQLDISKEKTELIMKTYAAGWGIDPIDECPDITAYDDETMLCIEKAAWAGEDICRQSTRLSPEHFMEYAKNYIKRKEKRDRIEIFIDRLRFPEQYF